MLLCSDSPFHISPHGSWPCRSLPAEGMDGTGCEAGHPISRCLSKTPCAVDLYFIPCYCLHNYRHSACPSVSKSCGAAVFCGARCGSPAVPVLGVGLSSLCHSSYLEFVVPGVLRFDSITHSYCEVLLQFLRVIALIY